MLNFGTVEKAHLFELLRQRSEQDLKEMQIPRKWQARRSPRAGAATRQRARARAAPAVGTVTVGPPCPARPPRRQVELRYIEYEHLDELADVFVQISFGYNFKLKKKYNKVALSRIKRGACGSPPRAHSAEAGVGARMRRKSALRGRAGAGLAHAGRCALAATARPRRRASHPAPRSPPPPRALAQQGVWSRRRPSKPPPAPPSKPRRAAAATVAAARRRRSPRATATARRVVVRRRRRRTRCRASSCTSGSRRARRGRCSRRMCSATSRPALSVRWQGGWVA